MQGLMIREEFGVFPLDGEAWVSSRKVAQVFRIDHSSVVRAIEGYDYNGINGRERYQGILRKTDSTWGSVIAPWFKRQVYIHPQNGQEHSEYLMNRNGFTLLAMGFTREDAFNSTVGYIQEFERIEDYLKDKAKQEYKKWPPWRRLLRECKEAAARAMGLDIAGSGNP